ncbi:hypothetical protein QBC44DRAFT_392235 [Cladorrhinum sp. PSN332]|nr:hypothetical protein QBC44DRAFT_392235 [Cladorrhinum sp. PSN332]
MWAPYIRSTYLARPDGCPEFPQPVFDTLTMLGRHLFLSLTTLACTAVCQVPVVKAINSLNVLSARLIEIRDAASRIEPISCVNFLEETENKRSGPWQDIENKANSLTEFLFREAVAIQRLPAITAFYREDGARMFAATESLEYVLIRLYDVIRSKAEGTEKALCLFLPVFGRRVANMLGGLHTGIETYENAIDIFNPEYKDKMVPVRANTRTAAEKAIGRFLVRV